MALEARGGGHWGTSQSQQWGTPQANSPEWQTPQWTTSAWSQNSDYTGEWPTTDCEETTTAIPQTVVGSTHYETDTTSVIVHPPPTVKWSTILTTSTSKETTTTTSFITDHDTIWSSPATSVVTEHDTIWNSPATSIITELSTITLIHSPSGSPVTDFSTITTTSVRTQSNSKITELSTITTTLIRSPSNSVVTQLSTITKTLSPTTTTTTTTTPSSPSKPPSPPPPSGPSITSTPTTSPPTSPPPTTSPPTTSAPSCSSAEVSFYGVTWYQYSPVAGAPPLGTRYTISDPVNGLISTSLVCHTSVFESYLRTNLYECSKGCGAFQTLNSNCEIVVGPVFTGSDCQGSGYSFTQTGPFGNQLYLGSTIIGNDITTTDAAGNPACVSTTATALAQPLIYTDKILPSNAFQSLGPTPASQTVELPALATNGSLSPFNVLTAVLYPSLALGQMEKRDAASGIAKLSVPGGNVINSFITGSVANTGAAERPPVTVTKEAPTTTPTPPKQTTQNPTKSTPTTSKVSPPTTKETTTQAPPPKPTTSSPAPAPPTSGPSTPSPSIAPPPSSTPSASTPQTGSSTTSPTPAACSEYIDGQPQCGTQTLVSTQGVSSSGTPQSSSAAAPVPVATGAAHRYSFEILHVALALTLVGWWTL